MDWKSLECPRCQSRQHYLLDPSRERHLRQCPTCDGWMVARDAADAGRGYRVDSLGDPPTCPVDGCEEVVRSEQLPPHIVQHHDGALV
jgi:hypothetical protein